MNGTVAKTLLLGGIDATVLSQVRATVAFLILLAFVADHPAGALRLRRSELPLLLVYGVLGIALTQFLYFASIERLPIGITLLIEFTAPLVIAVWFRVAWRHETKPVVWVALVTALVGLAIVAQVWEGLTLDPLGVAFAVGAMLALVVYYLSADVAVQRPDPRDPVSLTMWGMGAAALFWAIVQPPWTIPLDAVAGSLAPVRRRGSAGPRDGARRMDGRARHGVPVLDRRHLDAAPAGVAGVGGGDDGADLRDGDRVAGAGGGADAGPGPRCGDRARERARGGAEPIGVRRSLALRPSAGVQRSPGERWTGAAMARWRSEASPALARRRDGTHTLTWWAPMAARGPNAPLVSV